MAGCSNIVENVSVDGLGDTTADQLEESDKDIGDDVTSDTGIPRPSAKRRDPFILPQRRRGAHLVDAQRSLERWHVETWTSLYSQCPWSPEVILPSRVISNLAQKTYILTVDNLIEIGGLSRHCALRHGEEILSILHKVDERERSRRSSEKQKKLDERLERQRIAAVAREAKKVEAKRRREEERSRRPKKPRLSRAKKHVAPAHVAAEIGAQACKENVPLSPPSVLHPTGSWFPMAPFTPPRFTMSAPYFSPSSTPFTPLTASLCALPSMPFTPFMPPTTSPPPLSSARLWASPYYLAPYQNPMQPSPPVQTQPYLAPYQNPMQPTPPIQPHPTFSQYNFNAMMGPFQNPK